MKQAIILNKRIFAFESKEEFLTYVSGKTGILIALNAQKLNKSNSKLEEIINENIGYPDGVGAVLALKQKGIKSRKIAGAEFWLDIVRKYHEERSFYLLGGSQEVIEKTVNDLKEQFPAINIKGYRNGFMGPGEKEKLLDQFRISQPDIIFVAMGSPRQEFLMDELLNEYPALYMGLGGSFDVYSGNKKRAPKLFIKLGLEWFYRLLQEPSRWRRQLAYFVFFWRMITKQL
ncbi:MAG: WecB/TagA/CpsF family glycosyltransferase [Eudoraea sp.]|nr:WecB/TagA/CpsF family glycosyltransferase [Eudoraea sp.]